MESDNTVKRIVNKCHSVCIIMRPEMRCHITLLNLLFIPQVMSQFLRTVRCLSVCKSCWGLALKFPVLSHSSHFIKLQASESHKSWNRLCQCFFHFFHFFFRRYSQYGLWSRGLPRSHESRTWKPGTRPPLHKQAVPTSNGWQSCPTFLLFSLPIANTANGRRLSPSPLSTWQRECARSRGQR